MQNYNKTLDKQKVDETRINKTLLFGSTARFNVEQKKPHAQQVGNQKLLVEFRQHSKKLEIINTQLTQRLRELEEENAKLILEKNELESLNITISHDSADSINQHLYVRSGNF